MSATITIKGADLEALIGRALEAANTSHANASSTARALTLAEIDGETGHGLSRAPSYAAQARTGKVDGHAAPTARETGPAALLVDARHGFAYPAFDLALPLLAELARRHGIAAAAITRSHHLGVAGHHVERLAAAGLVALMLGNTPKAMPTAGGRKPLLGTNPIAFAAPRTLPAKGEPPLIVDMALSAVARGKIVAAAEAGRPLPEGWAVDAEGRPTTDAKAALAGALVPMGGDKGAALALMVEVLAACLTGARLSCEASSFFDDQGPPPGVGQLVIALDPARLAGAAAFAERMPALAAAIEADGARLPGALRAERRRRAHADGVAVDAAILEKVRGLSGAG